MAMTRTEQLIQRCQEMADHTNACCRATCEFMGACCSPEFCGPVQRHALEQWGLTLTPNEFGLLTDADGHCLAPPHTRLLCTVHQCEIADWSNWRGHPEWTERYFELRDLISEAAGYLMVEGKDADYQGCLSHYKPGSVS